MSRKASAHFIPRGWVDMAEHPSETVRATAPAVRGHFLVLSGAILWSTGGVCVKLLDGYSPMAISSGRSVVAALFFFLLLRGRITCAKRSLPWIAGGAVVYAAVVLSFVVATRLTTAANAILLQYTCPLWIAFLGWAVLRERPSSRDVFAMLVGGAGVVLCASGGLTLFVQAHETSRGLLGDIIALLSGLCFALMTILLRVMGRQQEAEQAVPTTTVAGVPEGLPSVGPDPTPAAHPSPALVLLLYGNVLTFAIGIPVLIGDLPHPGIPGRPYLLGLALLVWHGAGQLATGYWLFQRGLRTTRALTASLLGLVEPVLNPVWVALLVGEIPSPGTRWGGGLVLVSVVLSMTARPRREIPHRQDA